MQAIGRCAASIPEVTATCLSGLVALLSSPDQAVVAESVLEIKKLLQTQRDEHKDIISQMAKLIDTIEVTADHSRSKTTYYTECHDWLFFYCLIGDWRIYRLIDLVIDW